MNNFATLRQSNMNNRDSQKSFNPITRLHFQAMLIVMLLSLTYVTYTTQFSSPIKTEESRVLQSTQLVIKDDSNGDILIELINNHNSTSTGEHLGVNKVLRYTGEQGFLRGTLRALARERRLRNLTSDAPFELTLLEDGRLSINDTLTKKGIDLEAFGPDNVAVFVEILKESNKSSK